MGSSPFCCHLPHRTSDSERIEIPDCGHMSAHLATQVGPAEGTPDRLPHSPRRHSARRGDRDGARTRPWSRGSTPTGQSKCRREARRRRRPTFFDVLPAALSAPARTTCACQDDTECAQFRRTHALRPFAASRHASRPRRSMPAQCGISTNEPGSKPGSTPTRARTSNKASEASTRAVPAWMPR